MKKRILSTLLTAVLLVSGLAVPSSAAARQPFITQVAAGAYSFAVTSDGNLYGWGGNSFGLIDPSLVDPGWGWSNVPTPKLVMSGVKSVAVANEVSIYGRGGYLGNNVASMTGHHALIVKKDGELWAMGDNTCYQAGQGRRTGYEETKDYTKWDTSPVFVMDNVRQADCSGNASAAITNDGDLYFWGYNLAVADIYVNASSCLAYTRPAKILSSVKDVDLGFDHVLALKEDGTVWAMGCQDVGTLGNGKQLTGEGSLLSEMVKVMDNCVDIAAGEHTSYFVKSDGSLYVCGSNSRAKLGMHYNTQTVLTPVKIASNVVSVDASSDNACFIKTDGSLWTMGNDSFYQRGVYGLNDDNYVYPSKVTTNVKAVSMSDQYTLLLKNDDQMYGFGVTAPLGTGQTYYPNPGGSHFSDCPYIFSPIPVGISSGAYAGRFGPSFRDVASSAYYYDPVMWALEWNITSGTSATTFGPNDTCTRGQIITFLWKAAGAPEPRGSNPYTDVADSAYYAKAAIWAAEQGMFSGSSFAPEAPCTRLMAVEFMWKYADSPRASQAAFADVDSPAVNWAVKEGVTSGTSATTFSPNATCTRGQIVTFLYKAFS